MDLISKEDIIAIVNDSCLDLDNWDDAKEFCNEVRELPSPFYGMTNGEVMQNVYGVMVLTIKDGKVWVEKIYFPFDLEWWNAPYVPYRVESENL